MFPAESPAPSPVNRGWRRRVSQLIRRPDHQVPRPIPALQFNHPPSVNTSSSDDDHVHKDPISSVGTELYSPTIKSFAKTEFRWFGANLYVDVLWLFHRALIYYD
jgi:hypothetical protein